MSSCFSFYGLTWRSNTTNEQNNNKTLLILNSLKGPSDAIYCCYLLAVPLILKQLKMSEID